MSNKINGYAKWFYSSNINSNFPSEITGTSRGPYASSLISIETQKEAKNSALRSTKMIDYNSAVDIKNYNYELVNLAKREFKKRKLPNKIWPHFLMVFRYLKENINLNTDSVLANIPNDNSIKTLFGAEHLDIHKLNIILSNFWLNLFLI